MPILKRGPEIFPDGLFELPGDAYPWWVAHVRSRQEKALARYLQPFRVPFYLPQREHRKRRAGRRFVSYLPLFPGYLFFRGGESDRLRAVKSNLLVRLIPVQDQDLLDMELAQLYSLSQEGATFFPYAAIQPGDPIQVTEGPFRGYSGTVLRQKGRMRLIVSITMLRKSILVELERDTVATAASRSGVSAARSLVS
jgi:transcription antitermination factor NusG